MTAEEDNTLRSSHYEHEQMSIDAATEVTFHMSSGTDGDNDRYFDMPSNVSYGLKVIPTTSISITKINGITLKSAIPVGTGGWSTKNMKITSITLQTGAADVTSVEARG